MKDFSICSRHVGIRSYRLSVKLVILFSSLMTKAGQHLILMERNAIHAVKILQEPLNCWDIASKVNERCRYHPVEVLKVKVSQGPVEYLQQTLDVRNSCQRHGDQTLGQVVGSFQVDCADAKVSSVFRVR
jgi:hypothetical protein